MIQGVFQVHVYRPEAARAVSVRVAEQASFARQLGAAVEQEAETALSSGGAGHSRMEPWLRTQEKRALAGDIERASRAVGVDPALALAVAVAESSLDPTAQASDGLSSGTFQVRPSTAEDVRGRIRGGEVPRPPGGDDVALGVAYLRHLDDLFSTARELAPGLQTTAISDPVERQRFAVAAFNAGQGRVAGAQQRAAALGGDPRRFEDVRAHLPPITRGYVDRVQHYAGASHTSVAAG